VEVERSCLATSVITIVSIIDTHDFIKGARSRVTVYRKRLKVGVQLSYTTLPRYVHYVGLRVELVREIDGTIGEAENCSGAAREHNIHRGYGTSAAHPWLAVDPMLPNTSLIGSFWVVAVRTPPESREG